MTFYLILVWSRQVSIYKWVVQSVPVVRGGNVHLRGDAIDLVCGEGLRRGLLTIGIRVIITIVVHC